MASPAGAKEKDSTLVKLVINLKTDDGVADLNGAGDSSPFCGGGFVKNTAKELSATVCANDADTKKLFDTDYSVYKIDGSKLYFGHCGETGSVNDCSTAAKRATTLDTEEYFTKG